MKPATFCRLRKNTPCPICGHNSGCMIAADRSTAICMRVQEGCKKRKNGTDVKAKADMGWIHALDKKVQAKISPSLRVSKIPKQLTPTECLDIGKKLRNAMTPRILKDVAADLGVSENALRRMDAGYDEPSGAVTFPMYEGLHRWVIGFRLRFQDGRKLAMPGSRNGLFIPKDLELYALPDGLLDSDFAQLLIVPEGPTDCMAALDLGYRAIGRPNNAAGGNYLLDLLQKGKRQEVLLLADRDPTKYLADGTPHWPGWEGALTIASQIIRACGLLRVMKSPGKSKDLRQWLNDATSDVATRRAEMNNEIVTAPHVNAKWIADEFAKNEAWKLRLRRKAVA